MIDFRAHNARTVDDEAERADAAATLISRLEGEIGRDAVTRAKLLGSIATAGLVEPHRDHHAYALGADQAGCEFATGHARALRGLMSLGPAAVADRLEQAGRTAPMMHVTRLWPGILAADIGRYIGRGAAVDAKRLAGAAGVSPDQQTVFETAVALAATTSLHRDQLAYVCGADLYLCGLFADDALAMLGLMSIGPVRLARHLRAVQASDARKYVTRLWPQILAPHRDDFEARGQLVRWQRRWACYQIDHAAWRASPRRHDDDWRAKPMSARQRHLVRDTAILLGTTIPEEMDCGAAHDWLERAHANIIYLKEDAS